MSQVKTAVSIDARIFAVVDFFAKKIRVSRSRLFEIALREWVKKEKDKDLTASINRALKKIQITPEEKHQAELMKGHFRRVVQGEW